MSETVALNTHAERLRQVIVDTIAAGGANDRDEYGHRAAAFAINGYHVSYINYADKEESVFKPLESYSQRPEYALALSAIPAVPSARRFLPNYLFGVSGDLARPIVRSYKTGSLLGTLATSTLFRTERPLEDEEAEALIDFAARPHVMKRKIDLFTSLSEGEHDLLEAHSQRVKERREEVKGVLDSMAESRRRGWLSRR